MLNVTIPFAHRAHPGPFLLIGWHGNALAVSPKGNVFWCLPADAGTCGGHHSDHGIAALVDLYADTAGVETVTAQPAQPAHPRA